MIDLLLFILFLFIIISLYNVSGNFFIEKNPDLTCERIEIFKDDNIYYTENIRYKRLETINLYLEIPKCSYWIMGFYSEDRCLRSIDMSKYISSEQGDALHVSISDNSVALIKSSDFVLKQHNESYIHKKLLFECFSLDCDEFSIKLEVYNCKEIFFSVDKFIFNNITYKKYKENVIKKVSRNIAEDRQLYDKFISKISGKKIKVHADIKIKNKHENSLINISDIITEDFYVIAVNHFKSKAAIHSHLFFYDYDRKEIIKIEFTGIITASIFNDTSSMEIRKIKLKTRPEKLIIVEKIFFDSSDKIESCSLIPMEIFIV